MSTLLLAMGVFALVLSMLLGINSDLTHHNPEDRIADYLAAIYILLFAVALFVLSGQL